MDSAARHLAFHGAIVLLIGLLCGGPYARAINRGAPEAAVRAWRVAHASLPIGAVPMLSVAALLTPFAVGVPVKWCIALLLIVSSYAFCISLPLAAVTGHRGLSAGGPPLARLVLAGHLVGAWTSVAATLVLAYAAFVSS